MNQLIEKSKVSEVYTKLAPGYDLWAKLTESHARERCLGIASIRNGESVLEVAVGTGLAFAQILKANPDGRNEGIDLTGEMVRRAEQKAQQTGARNYRLSVGDAYDLPFSDATFDVLVNNYMFDLLPERDFEHVLEGFFRVLKPGGRLAMVNMTRSERWYHAVWGTIHRLNPEWLGGCRGVYLLPHLEQAGFERLSREFVGQMTFPSEVVSGFRPAG